MTSAPLPWQQTLWSQWMRDLGEDRLHHALLLSGQAGVGKRGLAEALAATALCQAPTEQGACGQCRGCTTRLAGTHPDLLRLSPLEPGKPIVIDAVRGLGEFMSLSAGYGRYKVVMIEPAEAMNTAAANSLLKLLEEPTPRTLLLLVSEAPARLPATVRSRCRHLRLGPPPADQALSWLRAQAIEGEAADWLALARGAPLAALALAQAEEGDARATVFEALGAMLRAQGSMQACVAACKGVELPRLIDWQIGWCEDLVRLALDGGAERLNHRDLAAELQALGESIDLERLFALRAELIAHRGRLHANLNRGLFLEDQLLSWLRATQGRPITQAGGR